MVIRRSADIAGTQHELFEYLLDFDNDPEWCPSVLESRLVEGARGAPGARYVQRHKPGPFPASTLNVELLEVEPPRRIVLRSRDELGTFRVTYELEGAPETATRLTQTDEIELHGLARLLRIPMRFAVRAGISRQFEQLRVLFDGR